MSQLADYEQKAIDAFGKSLHQGKWSNEALVQLIELAGSYMNLQPLAQYAKDAGLSYNGAKKFRNTTTILNHKFVIDNA